MAAADSSSLPDSSLKAADQLKGLVLWSLLIDHAEWVHRRVESIEVLDDSTARRRVSIDFTLPEDLPGLPDALPAIPLTFLRKRLLRRFDLCDEDGRALPMQTKDQNSIASANALVAAAETELKSALPKGVVAEVRALAADDPDDAKRRMLKWQQIADGGPGDHPETWSRLLHIDPFVDGARLLRDNFVLFAVLDPKLGERRVLKFGYDEPLATERRANPFQRVGTSLGWRPKLLEFEAPAASLAASYHLEVAAPEDLEVIFARLTFDVAEGRSPDTAVPDRKVDGPPPIQRAHLNPLRVEPGYVGLAEASVRAERAGFIRAALLTSALVWLLLLVGYLRLESVSNPAQAQVVSPLLLIVPTILGAFIIRPGEHRLASSVLIGTRVLLDLSVTCAISAAGALAAGWHDSHLEHIWAGALVIATVALGGLVLTNFLPPSQPKVEV